MRAEAVRTERAEISPQAMWSAFYRGDRRYDGRFVTAVRTTGIFCRPSCTCRKPRRENVLFYPSPAHAARAGYRPCKRCRP
ncbi:MAG TPA: Ada metal-binding domain-containing protein, partial [Candidatus Polarisedimenticolia bacterium]|nr:Ada metal-binding domain-containing protein [Candidatus Polarisedimenticolia bacterium]